MRVGIFGAGSIGCYIGACLIRGGVDLVLVGRERLRDEVAAHGMRVTDADDLDFRLQPGQVNVAIAAEALADCALILVTVKSADTESAAAAIAQLPPLPGRRVVSFQNGVRNAAQLRQGLPGMPVLAGMVPWNVVWNADAHFHRGTSGELMIDAEGDGAAAIVDLLGRARLRTLLRRDLTAVLWGKLLLNLNNPINALSGLPLRQQLATRGYRRLLAALMREALAVMHSADIRPAKAAKLPPRLVPWVLDLPDGLFLRVASSMLKLDPQARSSMWEDLQRGRATEIDYINGEVVRLAAQAGVAAPLNQALVELVHRIEGLPRANVSMSPEALSAELHCRIS
jgi:2-dehydropantoate 2-reductase